LTSIKWAVQVLNLKNNTTQYYLTQILASPEDN